MNSQDLLYNIAVTEVEAEDIMNALVDKANSCSRLQKKIFNQAIQQKKSFEQYLAEQAKGLDESNAIPLPVAEEKPNKKEAKK